MQLMKSGTSKLTLPLPYTLSNRANLNPYTAEGSACSTLSEGVQKEVKGSGFRVLHCSFLAPLHAIFQAILV